MQVYFLYHSTLGLLTFEYAFIIVSTDSSSSTGIVIAAIVAAIILTAIIIAAIIMARKYYTDKIAIKNAELEAQP